MDTHSAFLELKGSLESLGYTEPLGLDSCLLVRHITEDLLVTTENYDLLRRRAEAAERAYSGMQSETAPLRKEVSRLTRENNELHIEAVRLREMASLARHESHAAQAMAKHSQEQADFFAAAQRRVLAAREAELAHAHTRLATVLHVGGEKSGGLSPRPGGGSDSRSSSVGRGGEGHGGEEGVASASHFHHSHGPPSEAFLATIESLQGALSEAKAQAASAMAQLGSAREGLEGRDAEIARLAALVGASSPSSTSSTAGAPTPASTTAAATANARIISQLSEQVDFLTAELAARDAAAGGGGGGGGGPTTALNSNPANHPTQGLSRAVDAGSRVAALELEVTRLATRLESATRGKASAESEGASLRKEVASLQDLVLRAQASARAAAEEAEAASEANAASAENLSGRNPLAPRVGPTRARQDLATALKELARLQGEHARMSAAAEAVSLDRERFTRETARLEGALAAANTAAAAAGAAAAGAEAVARSARDDLLRATAETDAVRRALVIAKEETEAALHRAGGAERRCDTAGAELASLRPLVASQASDNERLRAEVAGLRGSLEEATTASRDAAVARDAAAAEAAAASGSAARSGATQGALLDEVTSLRREADTLAAALAGSKREEEGVRRELERVRESAAASAARVESLGLENSELAGKLATQARAMASASDTATRLSTLAAASGEIPALKAELGVLQRKATAAEIAADAAARARDRCEARCGDLLRDLEASRASLERTSAALAASERVCAEHSRGLADAEAKLAACAADRDHVSELLAQAHAGMGRMSVEGSESREEVGKAREEALRARITAEGAEARAEAARKGEAGALAEAEAYAAAAVAAEGKRVEAERARDTMAEDLASALRFAESSGGAASAARERVVEAEAALRAALDATAEEAGKVGKLRGELEQMKALFKQLDRTRASSDEQLAESMARIRTLTDTLAGAQRSQAEGSGAYASLAGENERLRAALLAAQGEEDGLSSKLDDASRRLAEQGASVAALQRTLAAARVENDAGAAETLRLTSTLASRDRENAVLRGALEECEGKAAGAFAERDVARAEAGKSHGEVGAMSKEIHRLAMALSGLQSQLGEVQAAHTATKVGLAQAEEALAHLRGEREVIVHEYRTLEQRYRALEGELRTSTELRTRSDAQLAALGSENASLQATLTHLEGAREKAEVESAHLAGTLGVLELELNRVSGEKAEAEGNVESARASAERTLRMQREFAARNGEMERELVKARAEAATAASRAAAAQSAEHQALTQASHLQMEVSHRDRLLAEERTLKHKEEVKVATLTRELEGFRQATAGAKADIAASGIASGGGGGMFALQADDTSSVGGSSLTGRSVASLSGRSVTHVGPGGMPGGGRKQTKGEGGEDSAK